MKKKKPEDNEQEKETTIEAAEPETEAEAQAEAPEEETAEETAESRLEKELAEAQAALADAKDKYLRIAAEYDNYRKRSQREREAIYADTVAQTVLALLQVYDNLERAAAQPTADEAYAKGVEMTLSQFNACLAKLGVKEIAAQGEQFDPNLHNAAMHVEQEGYDDNTVVEVFQKGFTMGDKVIRHATVKVAN